MTTVAAHEAVLMFAGPECWADEARERLWQLGIVTESPYELAYGEALFVLRADVGRDVVGRANTVTVLADLPGWACRGYAPESELATYRRGVQ